MKREQNGSVRVKKFDKNTEISQEKGKEEITVKYHGNVVMRVFKCGVEFSDGGYGYSVSLKKRLNDWLFGCRIFHVRKQPFISWNGHEFPLDNECFIVTNRFGDDVEFFYKNLRKSPMSYVERLVELYNQPECGALMVACDKLLSERD